MRHSRFEAPWYRLLDETNNDGDDGSAGDVSDDAAPDGDAGAGDTGGEGDQGGEGGDGSGDKPDEGQGSIITQAGKKKDGEGDGDQDGNQGEGDDDDGKPKASGAPDSYEDFTVPEGYEFKPETLTDFQAFAKENEFSQDQAQVLIDYHAQALKQYQELQTQQWADVRKEWKETTKADDEIGGPQMDVKMANVGKALAKFGTPGLEKVLDQMGIGDHPELVRFFYRVGDMIGEADLVPGKDSGGQKDAANVLYPNMA